MKGFFTILVACVVLAAVPLVWRSPLWVTRAPAAAKTVLPPPAPTPALPAAIALEKIPEPPQEIAQLPPSAPAPELSLADVVSNRALWPKQVTLLKATAFPVVINQRPMGTVTLPPGRAVEVLAISPQGLTLAYQGATQRVPAQSTNLLELARRLHLQPVPPSAVASGTPATEAAPPAALPPVPLSRAVPTPPAPPPIAVSQPLESIRHQPSAHPASIVPQIHAYLQNKIATTSGEGTVPLLAPEPDFGYVEALDLFDALEHEPGGLYRLAALVLQRADWLLTQPDPPSRLQAVYLASITGSSLARYAPDPLLTSAIFDAYLYPRIDLVPVQAGFYSRTRAGVISNCTRLFAPDDLSRRLQFFDLQYQYARTPSDRDAALYGKAYALNRTHRTKEALEVWSHIRRKGEMGWMKDQIADAWKDNLKKEQSATKKH